MQVLAIDLPKALVWQRLRALRRVLPLDGRARG
jgi:hypothetical protein